MILVSFFSEYIVLSDEIKICYIFEYRAFRFFFFFFLGGGGGGGTPGIDGGRYYISDVSLVLHYIGKYITIINFVWYVYGKANFVIGRLNFCRMFNYLW